MIVASNYIAFAFLLIYVNKSWSAAKIILPLAVKKVNIHLKPCFFSRIVGIVFT